MSDDDETRELTGFPWRVLVCPCGCGWRAQVAIWAADTSAAGFTIVFEAMP